MIPRVRSLTLAALFWIRLPGSFLLKVLVLMSCRNLRIIAGHELTINVRNRWTVLFALVFGALTLAISYFGLVTEAVVGFQGFTRTSASLLNLVLYLVPLVSLVMGTLSFTGDRGAHEFLFAQPVARAEILIGKLLGLYVSVVSSTLFGFGLAGLLISAQVGTEGLSRYLAFVGYALLLEACFLSLSGTIVVLCGTKAKAFGYALSLWFFFVLLYDLLAMGTTFLLKEHTANLFIFFSLFGNPVDLARVGSLISLGDPSIFGYAGAALVKFLGGRQAGTVFLLSALILWIILPLILATRVLKRQDI